MNRERITKEMVQQAMQATGWGITNCVFWAIDDSIEGQHRPCGCAGTLIAVSTPGTKFNTLTEDLMSGEIDDAKDDALVLYLNSRFGMDYMQAFMAAFDDEDQDDFIDRIHRSLCDVNENDIKLGWEDGKSCAELLPEYSG